MASPEMAPDRRSATGEWESLPRDIAMGILSRLPVKALCRSRCVSKSWSAMIADPAFVESHRNRSRRNPQLFLTRPAARCQTYHLDGTRIDEFEMTPEVDLRRVQGCIDLVCMYDSTGVAICNPATGEAVALPPSPTPPREDAAVGLGYATSAQEFKIIRIFHRSSHPVLAAEVFTLGRDTQWRAAGDPGSVHRGFQRVDPEAAFAHGAIHFLAKRMGDNGHAGIARFDLEREAWSVLLLPPHLVDECNIMCGLHGLAGGQLCLTSTRPLLDFLCGTALEIWLLKDYSRGEWVRGFTLHPAITEFDPLQIAPICPLSVGDDGRLLVHDDMSVLQYYDSQGTRLECFSAGKGLFDHCCLYVEGLFPPALAPSTCNLVLFK